MGHKNHIDVSPLMSVSSNSTSLPPASGRFQGRTGCCLCRVMTTLTSVEFPYFGLAVAILGEEGLVVPISLFQTCSSSLEYDADIRDADANTGAGKPETTSAVNISKVQGSLKYDQRCWAQLRLIDPVIPISSVHIHCEIRLWHK